VWETRVGEIPLRIPKLREGQYFPSLLEPRRQAEKALLAVVQAAYVQRVSTRKVDELLQALGLTGIDKSKVCRICRVLDELVEGFRNRPLEGSYPYLWLDALYVKVRHDHRIVSQALVVAIGVRETGEREILGLSLGQSEEYAFWLDFLRGLVRRGFKGVQLVSSDAHEGLKAAIEQVLAGSTWQRCRVHFMRNVLAHPLGKQVGGGSGSAHHLCSTRPGRKLPSSSVKSSRPWARAGPRRPTSWPRRRKMSWPT
jgi:transposase-like protein